MGEPNSELTLDLISTTCDRDVHEWLEKTASTATHPDQIAALYAGALAGLTRYMWANRKDGVTPEQLAEHVRRDVLHFATQARDHDTGGRA